MSKYHHAKDLVDFHRVVYKIMSLACTGKVKRDLPVDGFQVHGRFNKREKRRGTQQRSVKDQVFQIYMKYCIVPKEY